MKRFLLICFLAVLPLASSCVQSRQESFDYSSAREIQRVVDILSAKGFHKTRKVIRCSGDPYIAAGLGCAMTVSDSIHVNGCYPDAVSRVTNWFKITAPFKADGDYQSERSMLSDSLACNADEPVAPAIVCRHMALPLLENETPSRPFILSSSYPDGAVAVVSIRRVSGNGAQPGDPIVTLHGTDWMGPIGIFGYFESVTVCYPTRPLMGTFHMFARDLAGGNPVDVSDSVAVIGNRITVSGELIRRIGLMNATEGDPSGPGLVITIKPGR